MQCMNLSLTKLEEMLKSQVINKDNWDWEKQAKDFTNRVLASVIEIETSKPRVLRR